jgi:chromosome segregation ATPase
MSGEFDDSTPRQHAMEARVATLERVSDEHAGKISNQRGSLDAIHTDLGELRGHFTRQEGMVQALHLTQNEQLAAMRELRTGQEELRLDLEELRLGQEGLRHELTETRVGIQTIIGLLKSAEGDEDNGGEPGGSSPN